MATFLGLRSSALIAVLLCACTEGGQGSDDGSPRHDGGGMDGPATSSSGNVAPFAPCASFELFACCAWDCGNSNAWRDGEASCTAGARNLGPESIRAIGWGGATPPGLRCFRSRIEALHPEDSQWTIEAFYFEGPPAGAVCGYLTPEACDELVACVEEADDEHQLVELGLPSPGAECPASLQEPVSDDAGR